MLFPIKKKKINDVSNIAVLLEIVHLAITLLSLSSRRTMSIFWDFEKKKAHRTIEHDIKLICLRNPSMISTYLLFLLYPKRERKNCDCMIAVLVTRSPVNCNHILYAALLNIYRCNGIIPLPSPLLQLKKVNMFIRVL